MVLIALAAVPTTGLNFQSQRHLKENAKQILQIHYPSRRESLLNLSDYEGKTPSIFIDTENLHILTLIRIHELTPDMRTTNLETSIAKMGKYPKR
jgi:hypothetical protein